MNILVIDIGGTHVKLLATGHRQPVKIDSGRKMTPRKMVAAVKKATAGWKYDVVSIGYPAPVYQNRPVSEPYNLGKGWIGFNFHAAFHRPIKLINDAAMQALGSYEGGRMLFLGLGTGLGSALIVDGILEPMELAHLPYEHEKTYEDAVGEWALEKLGRKRWRKEVADVVARLKAALQVDYVVLGGGNARHLKKLPPGARLGDNANAFRGGYRLWEQAQKGKPRGRGVKAPARNETALLKTKIPPIAKKSRKTK